MTPAAAIHDFLSKFGLTAYELNSVPIEATFPYLTYSPVFGYWGDETMLQVNLWYKGTSNTEPNAKADQIGKAIGLNGRVIQCDGGAIWIQRGNPFCQPMADPADETIKRRYIVLDTKYFNN